MVNNNSPDILNFVTSLLNFPETVVTKISHSPNGREITLVVNSTRAILPCRVCNKPTHGHGLGRTLRFRHLSLLGKETYIEITPRRGICTDCDDSPTTTERLDWYERSSKMTKPYEQHLLFELVNSTVADVSRKEDIDYHAIEALIDRHIAAEIDFSCIKKLGVLGLDEISLKKGYRDFVTLVTYRVDEKVNVLGVVKGREKADIILFLQQIPLRLHKTIQAACCDLYEGYMNACQEVFKNKVPIVADRFHVRKLYLQSLVTIRKSELHCFDHFIKTLLKYQTQITNYFIHRDNSGFVEGFNNKVKVLKRRCYGLGSATRLFQRLIVDTVGMIRFAPGVVAF